MEQQQTPSFFVHGVSPLTKLVFFASFSLIFMATDAKFGYLVGVRQLLSYPIRPLEIIANSPFVLYNDLKKHFASVAELQHQLEREKNLTLYQQVTLQSLTSLQNENQSLRDLLGATKTAKPGTRIAEIIYTSRDPFSHKVVLNVGSSQNAVMGQAVIDANGVVGQVTRVFPYASEVTLLTDQELSVPVMVERNSLRAIAFGNGKVGSVDLPYLPANVDIRKGDLLVTSGIDGVYPQGLNVATVTSVTTSSDSPFAHIQAKPMAGIENHLQVLLLDLPNKNDVLEEVKKVQSSDKTKPSSRGHSKR
jgi:rod shape-determining protein MreC